MWYKTTEKKPEAGETVVALWDGRAMLCRYEENGDWTDKEHYCACWYAPAWWARLPKDKEK